MKLEDLDCDELIDSIKDLERDLKSLRNSLRSALELHDTASDSDILLKIVKLKDELDTMRKLEKFSYLSS